MSDLRAELTSLAARIYAQRSTAPEQPTLPLTLESLALFAQLRAQHRQACQSQLADKASTQDARTDMDRAQLELQNLMYEQQHLSREIKKCLEYEWAPGAGRLLDAHNGIQLAVPKYPDARRGGISTPGNSARPLGFPRPTRAHASAPSLRAGRAAKVRFLPRGHTADFLPPTDWKASKRSF
jgi:hypothetical protein